MAVRVCPERGKSKVPPVLFHKTMVLRRLWTCAVHQGRINGEHGWPTEMMEIQMDHIVTIGKSEDMMKTKEE